METCKYVGFECFTKSKFSHLLSLLFSYYFIVLLLHDVAYVVVVGLGIFYYI